MHSINVGVNETTQSHAPNRRSKAPWADTEAVFNAHRIDGFERIDVRAPNHSVLTSDSLVIRVANYGGREGAVHQDGVFHDDRGSQTRDGGSLFDQSTTPFADDPGAQRANEFAPQRWQNFEEFYHSTYPRMLRLGVALVWSKAVAEDHVQDAFAKTYAHFATLDEPAAYVRKTLVNEVRIAFRRKQMMQRLAPLMRTADFHSDRYTDDSLLKSLDALPLRQRTALILRYYEQCNEQEIAHALNCRPGTVKSLLSRGLASLRKVVDQ